MCSRPANAKGAIHRRRNVRGALRALRTGQRNALAGSIVAVGFSLAMASPANAITAVTISASPTKNMTCTNGVCSPTAKTAILNVSDLETMLASGGVTVKTGNLAKYIIVATNLGWSTPYLLTLDANQSVFVKAPVSVAGAGGLAVVLNDGGTNGVLSFAGTGQVSFANLSSSLTIAGAAYTLAGDVKTLASDIRSNPGGHYALANSYDASGDGVYSGAPITATLTGTLEGLGNTISNLSISDTNVSDSNVGLFETVGSTALLQNLSLSNITLNDPEAYSNVGAVAGTNDGMLRNVSVSGIVGGARNTSIGGLVALNNGIINGAYSSVAVTVSGNASEMWIGGLVGENTGNIFNCAETGTVSASGPHAVIGGLVGLNGSTISVSWATGAVVGGIYAYAGGLVGANGDSITNAYAMGTVTASDKDADVGGLVGVNFGPVLYSYSTGAPSGGTGSLIGGLIGNDQAVSGSLLDTYWDTTTSGIANSGQGAGNIANDPGITAITTAQLQSQLPAGFATKVWGEKTNINNGLPYLLAAPP